MQAEGVTSKCKEVPPPHILARNGKDGLLLAVPNMPNDRPRRDGIVGRVEHDLYKRVGCTR